jgi:hypothetical protein
VSLADLEGVVSVRAMQVKLAPKATAVTTSATVFSVTVKPAGAAGNTEDIGVLKYKSTCDPSTEVRAWIKAGAEEEDVDALARD